MVVGGTNSLSVKQERFCISTCPGFHYQSESWKENSALHRRSKGNLLQLLPEEICPCSFNSFIWCPQQQGILLLISVLFQGINLPKNPHSFAKPGEFFRLPSCLWTTDGCIYWTTALVKSLRDSLTQTPTFSTTWAWFISFFQDFHFGTRIRHPLRNRKPALPAPSCMSFTCTCYFNAPSDTPVL